MTRSETSRRVSSPAPFPITLTASRRALYADVPGKCGRKSPATRTFTADQTWPGRVTLLVRRTGGLPWRSK
jgi:hypothetical protein